MKKFGIIIFLSILLQAVFAEEPVYAPIGLCSSDEYNFAFHDGKKIYVMNQLNGNYAKIPDKYISIFGRTYNDFDETMITGGLTCFKSLFKNWRYNENFILQKMREAV